MIRSMPGNNSQRRPSADRYQSRRPETARAVVSRARTAPRRHPSKSPQRYCTSTFSYATKAALGVERILRGAVREPTLGQRFAGPLVDAVKPGLPPPGMRATMCELRLMTLPPSERRTRDRLLTTHENRTEKVDVSMEVKASSVCAAKCVEARKTPACEPERSEVFRKGGVDF